MSMESSPVWLPTGWTEQYKFLKSGRRITHYVNATGQKFFTKDELIRYTKTCSTERNGVQLNSRQTKVPSTKGHNNTAVNAHERPEWLPKNWFMEMKTYKTGANIKKRRKIYVDPSTGSRFYSKPEVLRFCNHVEQKSSRSAQKTRPLNSTCKKSVTANERPDWLPNNWFMELKTHMSGAKMGRHYKIYVDPSTGFRFYSKPEVLRFLNRVEQESSSSAKKTRPLHSTCKTAVTANERPEWLPTNWFMELKPHMSSKNMGRHKKIYVDPSTGLRFYSKQEVLQFLTEVMQKRSKSKQKNRGSLTKRKAAIEKSVVGDLPAGWIKKVKIRRNDYGVRRDRYYIDPASGYVFRSKKGVLHYLETGEIGKHALLPEKKRIDDKKASDSEKSLPAAKRQKVEHPATRQQLIKAEVLELKKLLESGAEKVNNIKSKKSGKSKNKKELNLPRRFSTRLARPEPELVDSVVKPCQNESNGPRVSEDKATRQLNFRSNAGAVKQSSIDSTVKSRGNLMNKTINSAEGEDIQVKKPPVLETLKASDAMSEIQPSVCLESANTTASSVPQEKKLGKKRVRSKSSSVKTKNSNKSKKLNNCPDPEHPHQASVSEISKKPHEDKALLGNLPQMLGTHKGGDSKSELQPIFCSDPCLEFAIKTLTGAIPLEDAITEGLVSTPVSNIQQQKNLAESRIINSSSRKGLFNSTRSKKKDRILPCALEQLAGNEQEIVENSLSNEGVKRIAVRKSCNSNGIQNADLTSEILTDKQHKTDPIMAVERHGCTYKTNMFHVGSLNKGKEPHQNQTVPTDMKNEKPGLQSTITFGNPWSGPAENIISFESYFKQQFGSSGTQRGGDDYALPYFGLPNVSQSELSSQLDSGKQPVVQHFPVNASFLAPDNKSVPSFRLIGFNNLTGREIMNHQAKGKK